jgi:hypothetical protein
MFGVTRVTALALALVSASTLGAAEPTDWPVDLSWVEEAKRVSQIRGEEDASRLIESKIEFEQRLFLESRVIAVGRVVAVDSYEAGRGKEIRTAITIAVDECVKGDCPGGSIVTHILGGSVADRTFTVRGTEPPQNGELYVFRLRSMPTDPGLLWGGYRTECYRIEDGVVARKGVTLKTFLECVRELLSTRAPEILLESCDAAVVGVVEDYRCDVARPAAKEAGCKGVESAEAQPESAVHGAVERPIEEAHNYIDLHVGRVVKGAVDEGTLLHVVLPYLAGAGSDFPMLAKEDQVLLFLRKTEGGAWEPLGGTDSALLVRGDGSVGHYESVEALAATVE